MLDRNGHWWNSHFSTVPVCAFRLYLAWSHERPWPASCRCPTPIWWVWPASIGPHSWRPNQRHGEGLNGLVLREVEQNGAPIDPKGAIFHCFLAPHFHGFFAPLQTSWLPEPVALTSSEVPSFLENFQHHKKSSGGADLTGPQVMDGSVTVERQESK